MFLIKLMHYCIVKIYVNMQGDIFYCIAYRYAKRYQHMQRDIFYCIAIGRTVTCQFHFKNCTKNQLKHIKEA